MDIKGYINRIRHNRGYGVQSPSAFFFVTEVLGEKLPYQAYPEIERITGKKGTFCTKRAKDLFRITNYTKPASCIAVESPVAASVMALAKPSALTYSLTKQKEEKEEHAAEHLERTDFRMLHGDICKTLEDAVKETGHIGLLYIGTCEEQAALIEAALPHTNKNSIIVVEGINRDKKSRIWWQEVASDPRTIVTYDAQSYGILFFDNEKCKQNYTLRR